MTKKITIRSLQKMKQAGEKFACLTAYDASFSRLEDEAGVDVLLVGDSLGMALHGDETTLNVSMTDMIYHTRLVSTASKRALIMSDMPYKSYTSPVEALENANRLIKKGGAAVVKLEGGAKLTETIKLLKKNNIPVCCHLGLMPQSVKKPEDYRLQVTTGKESETLKKDALALQKAGADFLVLECVPAKVATEVSGMLKIPVIGIGAGAGCDAQVLVIYDMLGMNKKQYKFSKDFLVDQNSISDAIKSYVHDVKSGLFPAKKHSY